MRAICICLPENPEKNEKAREHFASRGLVDVDFLYGINAPIAGLATWHPYEVDHPGSGFRMGSKTTGNWLSHYIAWTVIARMPSEDAVLVLEDDAQLVPDFSDRWARAMRDVPNDFDFLHLGHCCLNGRWARPITGDIHEVKEPMCTHAYVLRQRMASVLVKTMRKCWAPIDIQLSREIYPLVKVYAVMPRIAAQFDTVIPE